MASQATILRQQMKAAGFKIGADMDKHIAFVQSQLRHQRIEFGTPAERTGTLVDGFLCATQDYVIFGRDRLLFSDPIFLRTLRPKVIKKGPGSLDHIDHIHSFIQYKGIGSQKTASIYFLSQTSHPNETKFYANTSKALKKHGKLYPCINIWS